MAKKDPQEVQLDMFPVEPIIKGLGITKFEVKQGDVTATLTGSTLVNDVAQLTNETWKKAIAEWIVTLCDNDGGLIESYIDEARAAAYERERDREAMKNAMNTIAKFPSGAESRSLA